MMYGYETPDYLPEYAIGVTATWNIFNGGSDYRKIKSSEQKQQQIYLYEKKIEDDITLAITNSYKECQLHIDEIEAYKIDVEYAMEVLRVKKLGFKERINSANDVADAQLAYSKAQIEQLNAVYNYEKSLIDLLYYSGNLEDFFNYSNNENSIKYINKKIN